MSANLIQQILVPTDMSDFSRTACTWAGLFQRRLGSRVTLMYANEPFTPVDILEAPAALILEKEPGFVQQLQKRLSAFAAESFPDRSAPVATLIVDAAPAQAIVQAARKIDADVILMGTHGRHGWRRALLGSVTENVLRATSQPLMSIPAKPELPHEPSIEKIICPVNFTDIGRLALEEAVALAAAFDARLHVVYVADDAADPSRTHIEEDFAAWIEPKIRHRCRYSRIVVQGGAAEQILRIADEDRADLLVIGAQHKRFSDSTIIGTTSERIVRFARQPVWTVVSPAPAVTAEEPIPEGTTVLL